MNPLTTFPLALMTMVLVGCSSTEPAQRTVSRVEVEKTIDLSGRWNDSDSRLVADALINDVFASAWLEQADFSGKIPVVTVGNIRNKTSEHIDVSVFIKDLQKAIVESGKAKFIASKPQRKELRDEKRDQQEFAREETVKEMAAETGADVMLQGQLSSVPDRFEGKTVIFYQMDLEAVDIETGEIVWTGQKKIKKFIEQDKWQW
ncbi:MAG: penicillin-binding protein activator LpoB [Bacteroidetes bacterium]|nr:penicillin-binding protein activator LpoB [Bacteroidota bacterium]